MWVSRGQGIQTLDDIVTYRQNVARKEVHIAPSEFGNFLRRAGEIRIERGELSERDFNDSTSDIDGGFRMQWDSEGDEVKVQRGY
jgi:hypothetical protein